MLSVGQNERGNTLLKEGRSLITGVFFGGRLSTVTPVQGGKTQSHQAGSLSMSLRVLQRRDLGRLRSLRSLRCLRRLRSMRRLGCRLGCLGSPRCLGGLRCLDGL